MKAAIIVVAFLLASATDATTGETTVGRWCDRAFPAVMTIVITDRGKAVLKWQFRDGSSVLDKLREAADNIYERVGSRYGSKFRIVPNTGNLQLLDKDGFIRLANRLENTPQRGECLY